MNRIELEIAGMSCPGCEGSVERALEAVAGVVEATANYGAGTAEVEVRGDVGAAVLVTALEGAGYSGHPVDSRGLRQDVPGVQENGSGPREFDLIVLGGGSAGFAAAIRASDDGARVALVNHGAIGGTCVNVGCIPSKALIRSAEAQHRRAHHGFAGVPSSNEAVSWAQIREQKDELVEGLRQAKYVDVLSGHPSITLFEGRGVVGADGTVTLDDGRRIEAGKVVVTTGSSPKGLDVPGLEEAGYLTSTSLMDVQELPGSLVVLGAGSVGLELAQAMSRLGVDVTVIARSDRVLSKEDPDLGYGLMGFLEEEGIHIVAGASLESVEVVGAQRRVRYAQADGVRGSVTADAILVAAGRSPNTAGMGLSEAGVELGPSGELLVDESLQSSNPRVYAAGDVTGEPMHVYVAAQAGGIAAANALHDGSEAHELRVVPSVTFTDPAVATVGLTEEEARARGFDPITSKLALEHVPRALAARDSRGFIKLVADAGSRRIIGAHILAPEAGELIMEPSLAIRFGLGIEDLTSTLHPYLTQSEGIKLAAQTFDKDVSKLSCCSA